MPISFALHVLFVAFLVIAFPLWDRHETRRLKTSTDPDVRLRSYQKTIGWQVIATALLLATIPARQLITAPARPRELSIDLGGHAAIPIVIGLMIGAVVPILNRLSRRNAAPAHHAQLASIAFFLPRGHRERAWFAAMSVVVGGCEEIVFRGFLIRFFAEPPVGFGVGAGVAAAALVFGIDHGYQGVKGIVATGVLALVFTALFFATGTLWLPMLLHALLDLRVLAIVPKAGVPWPPEADATVTPS